jgi:hypothetical protein
MQLHSLSASCGLRARLGRWLRGSAAPGRAQIRVCRRFRLHQPGSHGPQSSLQLGSTATPKSGVVNWLGRVERAWAVMRRWPHLPARPLSFTPTSSSSSCNGGVTPSCIGTRARRRRAEEVGAAPSLTSHAGADGHLVLVESAMGFAVSGSWWRRRWGGAPPAGRPWSTPPLPCRWRRWHPPSLPPVDLERWPRLGRSSDDRGSGSSPLASDRQQTSSEARRGTPSGGASSSLVTTIGTERPGSVRWNVPKKWNGGNATMSEAKVTVSICTSNCQTRSLWSRAPVPSCQTRAPVPFEPDSSL